MTGECCQGGRVTRWRSRHGYLCLSRGGRLEIEKIKGGGKISLQSPGVYLLSALEAAFTCCSDTQGPWPRWNQHGLRSTTVSTRTNNLSNNERRSGFSCQSSTRRHPIGQHGRCCTRFTHVRFRDPGPGSRVSAACARPPCKNCAWLLHKQHFYNSGTARTRASQTALVLTD